METYVMQTNKNLNILCPSCHSSAINCLGTIPPSGAFAGRRLDKPLSGGELYECKNCYLWFRYPRMTKAELDTLYVQGDAEAWGKSQLKRKDWEIGKHWITSLVKRGEVLDVGCFDGCFLATLSENYQKFGFEIHSEAANSASKKQIQILGDDFSVLAKQFRLFDVITAFDVIEHVLDPLTFLQSLAESTRPGGWIILSTGNTQSWSWQFMGSRYWYCNISDHISFINPQWCIQHAESCGLEVIKSLSFSHGQRGYGECFSQTGKNLLYRILPMMFRWLRTHGYGKMKQDIAQNPELSDIPPGWDTVKDHFITLFRKK